MGGNTYTGDKDCNCNPCTSDDCETQQEQSLVCMINPLIKCEKDGCMAWAKSQEGNAGQCLHGIFKQMIMQSLGVFLGSIGGMGGNIVKPR
jgi:hypothetical protein